MKPISLSILGNDTAAPLYHVYPQQYQAQPAYIEFSGKLTEDGAIKLEADYSGDISGVPANVWHGLVRRLTVPAQVSRSALESLASNEEFIVLVNRMHAGFDSDWNGNNYVGTLTDDAKQAEEEIEQMLQSLDCAEVWDAADWCQDISIAELIENGSVAAYAKKFADAADANQVINGNCVNVIASDVEHKVLRYISQNIEGREDIKQAIALLIAHDSDYQYLADDYAAEFENK